MKAITLWYKLKVLFNKKLFDSYIDKVAFEHYNQNIIDLNSEVEKLNKRIDSTLDMIKKDEIKGVAGISYGYGQHIEKANIDWRPFRDYLSDIPLQIKDEGHFTIGEKVIQLNIDIARSKIRSVECVKEDMAEKFAKYLLENNYIDFTKYEDPYGYSSLLRPDIIQYNIVGKLKTFK